MNKKRSALIAAFLYFAFVFAVGFLLGTLRVIVVAPRLGELIAVLIELPVMLAACWWSCGRIIDRFRLERSLTQRGTMGVVAFGLLIAVEFFLSVAVFGRSSSAYWSDLQAAPGMLGFAAQMLFGTLPLIRR